MRVKYNRTSTIQQEGERFKLDKDNYDLTIFDKGVSGKIPFSEREGGIKLTKLVNEGKVKEVVVEELSRLGRNTIDTLTTLKSFEEKGINVVVRGMGNLQSMVNGKKNPSDILSKHWAHHDVYRNIIKPILFHGGDTLDLLDGAMEDVTEDDLGE